MRSCRIRSNLRFVFAHDVATTDAPRCAARTRANPTWTLASYADSSNRVGSRAARPLRRLTSTAPEAGDASDLA